MEMNRLFFALQPTDEARAGCRKAALDLSIKMQPGTPLTPAVNYHLTLLFLGHAVSQEQETAAIKAAGQVQGEPLSLTLNMAASFAESNVWWLGMHEPPAALMALRADIYKKMSGIGITLDRARFTPHVTVTRSPVKLPTTVIKPIEWSASEFVLMRSSGDAVASVYEVIARWPLRRDVKRIAEQFALW